MEMIAVALSVSVSGLLFFVASGCSAPSDSAGDSAGTLESTDGSTEPPPTPLDARNMSPVLVPVGLHDGAISRVTAVFARDVVTPDAVGRTVGDRTRLEIDPPLAGQLTFQDRSTLVFEPSEPLEPGTRYDVRLLAVETTSGVIEAPTPDSWSLSFETQPFRFLRADVASYDADQRQLAVDLVFSGAIEPRAVADAVVVQAFSARGEERGAPRRRVVLGDEPNVARLTLTGGSVVPGARFELELREATVGDERARLSEPATASVEVAAGAQLSIKAAYVEESHGGFAVSFVCDDTAIEGRRWYWDRTLQSSYQISPRCGLGSDDATKIDVSPPVDFSVTSSSGGFKLLGDFSRGAYTVRVASGARSSEGSVLQTTFEQQLVVPARSPQLNLQMTGRYLPRDSWRSVPVRHLNVEQARLEIRHVPTQNLVYWMSDDHSERADERESNLVATFDLPLRGEVDQETTTFVDLGTHVDSSTRGLLEVSLAATGAQSRARLLLTDLMVVAKRTGTVRAAPWGDGVEAWVLDSHSLDGLRGAEVRLVRKSGKVLASCTTSRSGGCSMSLERDADPAPPFALLVERGDDVTYLKFSELEAEVQEERIAGAPYRLGPDSKRAPYRAAPYSDRGVYRPGETAHLAAIVRDEESKAPQAGMPVEMSVVDARGKLVRRTALQTNDAGFVQADIDFADYAPTGRWEAKFAAAERPIGNLRFQVEEFVPERLKVEVAGASDALLLGDPIEAQVDARYLFGGVPAGQPVELSCELEPSVFSPDTSGDFQFGLFDDDTRPRRPVALGMSKAQLDASGQARLACPTLEVSSSVRGTTSVVLRAGVQESGSGRATVGLVSVPVHPADHYVGLKSGSDELGVGQPATIEGILVDWDGQRLARDGEVAVELLRLEEEYGLFYDEALGRESYRRYRRPVVEERRDVAMRGGSFSFDWEPTRGASGYVARVSFEGARTELSFDGRGSYWWSPWQTQGDLTAKPGRPTWIALDAPEVARVGERFSVTWDAPYSGRMLVALETDEIVESQWLDVEAGPGEWTAEIARYVPNVYATAFLVKDPHLESERAFLPDRAFGVRSIPVEPEEFSDRLALVTPNEVRSNSELTIELDLGRKPQATRATYATVAVVDEGILQLTRFESPDPSKSLFAQRALGVETFETVGWSMLLPPAGSESLPGGGRAGLLDRVTATESVALFAGPLPFDEDGKLTVSFDIPEYQGSVRVMAVSAGPERLGHAEADVFVRDPLVLQTTLPRFLIRDDEITVPAFVTNSTDDAHDVTVSLDVFALDVSGLGREQDLPVEIVGPQTRTLRLASGASGTVDFRVRALASAGAARFVATASAGDLETTQSSRLPLLPAGPTVRSVQRVDAREGTVELTRYLDGWEPMSERSTFWLTNNPYADVMQHMGHLVRYPYGCLEQTTSSTRPLLELTKFVPLIDPKLLEDKDLDDMVQKGIDRILNMQTPGGGFAYWPGGSEEAYWASAYALHFLLDATERGYEVDQSRIDRALDWMERELTKPGQSREDWYSSQGGPYMHYVMALAGRGLRAQAGDELRRLREPNNGMQLEDRYLLWAALHKSGDHSYEAQLKRPALDGVRGERIDGWSFYSDRRRRGLVLSTLVELFGADPAALELSSLVADGLRGQRSSWYTTQELVWGLVGLSRFVEEVGEVSGTPRVVANGARLEPDSSELAGNWTWALARASEYRSLTLEVPPHEGNLFLIVSSEGVRTNPAPRPPPRGVEIVRTYRRASGEIFDPGAEPLDLGEVVHVELAVANTSAERVTNLALVDRLAAGLEIENSRLGRSQNVPWIDAERIWEADHLDLRDDRVEVFGTLERGARKSLHYSVRATGAGRFQLPGALFEAMYNPDIQATTPSGSIVIAGGGER